MAQQGAITWCESCGKLSYLSRKHARAVIRVRNVDGVRPYRCPAAPGYWHLGHLPPVVRAGVKTRREIYGEAG